MASAVRSHKKHTKSSPAYEQRSVSFAGCYLACSGHGDVWIVCRLVAVDAYVDDFDDAWITFKVSFQKIFVCETSILLLPESRINDSPKSLEAQRTGTTHITADDNAPLRGSYGRHFNWLGEEAD